MTYLTTICVLSLFAWWFVKFIPVWMVYFSGLSSVVVHVLNVLIVLRYTLHIVSVYRDGITFSGVHPAFIEMVRTTRLIRGREKEAS